MTKSNIAIALLMSLSILMVIQSACKPDNQGQSGIVKEKGPSQMEDSFATVYLQKGQQIASATKASLGKVLRGALAEGGVEQAIPLCNLQALPIADSMSKANDCEISRTALLYRNPANEPDEEQTKVMTYFASKLDAGEMPSAQLWKHEQEVRYYAPILTLEFCLQCHGSTETDISTKDYALIKEYYPDDQATGFAEGQMRGMWSISFPLEP